MTQTHFISFRSNIEYKHAEFNIELVKLFHQQLLKVGCGAVKYHFHEGGGGGGGDGGMEVMTTLGIMDF